MFFYALYCIGALGARLLPRRLAYGLARRVADFCCFRASCDREAVRENLQAILGQENVPDLLVRDVFRNFGMYLVDFFRFGRLTPDKIRRMVRFEGLHHMEEALGQGKGVIGLTAHLGNFELAGAVLSLLGLPVNAVVLTHTNHRVNRFFNRQRDGVGVRGIPLNGGYGKVTYEACKTALKKNEILALVGDRDFLNHGVELEFFGKKLKVPIGPAAFSFRTGAPIVPGFLVREKDGTYRFILEEPLKAHADLPREEAIHELTERCLISLSRAIRRYPTQWYMFQKFWSPGPATIL